MLLKKLQTSLLILLSISVFSCLPVDRDIHPSEVGMGLKIIVLVIVLGGLIGFGIVVFKVIKKYFL
jgi:hypothetical protein